MVNTIKTYLALAGIVSLLLSSCTSLSEERMVPEFKKTAYESSQKKLRVNVLVGVFHYVESGFQQENLDAEMLQKALVLTMDRSRIFKEIVFSEQSDYELIAEKKRQTIKVVLGISYKLKDSKTNELLWQEEILTLGMCTIKEAYNGYTRCNTALERALKKSLKKSLKKISDSISSV